MRRTLRSLCALVVAIAGPAPMTRAQSGSPTRAPTLVELIEAASLSGLSRSPDGRSSVVRVARPSVSENRVKLDWWAIDARSGVARLLADGGAAIHDDPGLLRNEQPIWSPDSASVFLRVLRDDGVQLERIEAATGRRLWRTREAGDVESVGWERTGVLLAEISPPREAIEAAELREYREGVLVDHSVDMAQPLFRGGHVNGRAATQRFADSWFGRAGLLASDPRERRLIDLATGQSRSADLRRLDVPPGAVGGAVGTERTIQALARVVDVGGRNEVAAGEGSAAVTCPSHCLLAQVDWIMETFGKREIIVGGRLANGRTRLVSWRPNRRPTIMLDSDLVLNGGTVERPCVGRGGQLICVASGPASPPALVRLNLDSGTLRTIFDPNRAMRRAVAINARRLTWTSADGRKFHGIFYPAASGTRPPLFVNYYLCRGWQPGGLGNEWPFAALASRGIAALCIDKAPEVSDPVSAYRAAQAGIEAIVARLRGEGTISDGPIGIGGLSFGSEVAMWVARRTDLVGAVSIASIQVEPSYWWFNAVRGRAQPEMLRKTYGLGSPDETPDVWRLLSPARDTAAIRAPVLIQVPEQEGRMMMELHSRLSRSRTPVEMRVFSDEPHLKTQPAHRRAVYERNLDWFRFWLSGVEDPEPGKRSQYQHWRALRCRAAAGTNCAADSPRAQSSTAAN